MSACYTRTVRRPDLDLIAFDADDTLWHNERSYRDGRERFRRVLATAGVTLDGDSLDAAVNRTEVGNIDIYGYGVSSFALSLIETAIELTDGRIGGEALREVIALGKEMLQEEIELFPHVREVLTTLARSYPLMLITKGDLLHQTAKVERSGLRECFAFVEVVSHKTVPVYTAILSRHRIEPARFVMIGNSLRSDILPIVELGGRAVHVPAALSWSPEHAEIPPGSEARFVEVAGLDEVPGVIERLPLLDAR